MDKTCKTCGKDIVWARFVPSGKPVPIDKDSRGAADGGVVVFRTVVAGTALEQVPGVWAVALKKGEEPAVPNAAFTRYRTHFQSCPQAAEHSKKA